MLEYVIVFGLVAAGCGSVVMALSLTKPRKRGTIRK